MIRFILHKILGSNKTDIHIKNFAKNIRNKHILEIGSGKKVNEKYPYSFRHLFHGSNEFLQSDINPSFGHKIINVNKMKFKNKFDIIICCSVLEHDFDFQKAFKSIFNALKKDGIALISVPTLYPLHDEPYDYWRFTEHSLRLLLKDFREIKMMHTGLKKLPFIYNIEAKK
jgi:SAM-dependent methyltransferase